LLGNICQICNKACAISGNSWRHCQRWLLQSTRSCFQTTTFFTNSTILLLYKNKLLDIRSDDGDVESDDSDSDPSTSKATEMCKYAACLQLVTVMLNYVNISDCDHVDSNGVDKNNIHPVL
jgi:hypothetical protein